METIQPVTPPDSVQMSPDSPQTVAFDDMVPMSPNRVQVGKSQDVPDQESVFDVSPVTPGFLMRPSGTAVKQPVACLPLPQALDTFSDPVLGDPKAFSQCAPVPGSDAPLTLPVHTMPSGLAFMPGQSSVQTVMVSTASSRPEGWSSGMPRTSDISREGPFDAYASPMDTEDSPLVTTGLPGCPYRITSCTGPAVADTNPAFGMQLHHPWFLEFIWAPDVFGTTVTRGGCYGGSGQSTAGRWYHVVEPSNSFAVRYVAAWNVFRDDDSGYGTCGVPFRRGRGIVYSTKSARAAKYMAAMRLWRHRLVRAIA